MNDTTLEAFSNELVKIALFKTVRRGLVNTMKEGWHGSLDPASPDVTTWFGKGRQIQPGMSRGARMWEEMSSLGGATRALPVGAKTMMAVGTGLMARDAMRPQDPTGQNRSRTERMTGLAANTVGGLVGSAMGNRFSPGLVGSLAGGYAGGLAAEKLVTSPFAAFRRNSPQVTQSQYPQQPPPNTGAQV
jgi:hypothetical protein